MTRKKRVVVSSRLITRLQALADDVAGAASLAVEEGTRDVAETARDASRHADPSGHIAETLRVETLPDGLTALVAAPVDYARYLEWGTRYMPPRPFLQPAMDLHRSAITQSLTHHTHRALSHKGKTS